MKILAIDTVTEACSAALSVGGEAISRFEVARNRHSSILLPMVEELLAEADLVPGQLDAVAFDRGPGSFTGVRIGAGVAQGIAFAASLPLLGISSLQALAADRSEAVPVLALIDARMGQVYWALYGGGDDAAGLVELAPERLSAPDAVATHMSGVIAVGSGWDRYEAALRKGSTADRITGIPGCFPKARTVCDLARGRLEAGDTGALLDAVPVYLRDDVAARS